MKKSVKRLITILFLITFILDILENQIISKVKAEEELNLSNITELDQNKEVLEFINQVNNEDFDNHKREEVIKKVVDYLIIYFQKQAAAEDEDDHLIDNEYLVDYFPKEQLIKKLVSEDFDLNLVEDVVEEVAEKRKEKVQTLVKEMIEEENKWLSRNRLLQKLEKKDFFNDEFICAIELLDLDWELFAEQTATYYLSLPKHSVNEYPYPVFSRSGLISWLVKEEGFTRMEATYGVDATDTKWTEQAVRMVEALLENPSYLITSRKDLVERLIEAGFTSDEAWYAVNHAGIDWQKKTLEQAEKYLKSGVFSKETISELLKEDGFTELEVKNAIDQVFGIPKVEQAKKTKKPEKPENSENSKKSKKPISLGNRPTIKLLRMTIIPRDYPVNTVVVQEKIITDSNQAERVNKSKKKTIQKESDKESEGESTQEAELPTETEELEETKNLLNSILLGLGGAAILIQAFFYFGKMD